MSDTNQDKTARTPRLTIDQSAAPASEPVDSKAEAAELQDAAAADFDEAMGLIKGTGAAIWSYAVRHPNTTLGAVAGFILAVLVLTLGLWDTLVIAFFVLIGAVIGQIRDGENGIVNFFGLTDRGVWAGLAEMIEPYEDTADAGAAGKTVVEEPEWDLIESELRAIDADGFRYSLHCQGDGAVRRTVALYASLPRDEHGRMLRRHAITDLENSDPTDLVEFGKLGGICEVYPQILTLDRREDCLSMMRRQIGETRLLHSWNRRGMVDSGCTVCCGTDLPLLIPSLGESIYSACGGFFADGLPVNEVNTLTLVELLRAWTAGGAYDLMREDELGTLEVGKLADICVLDRDVFDLDYRDARDLAVDMTMSDGQIVFDRNKEA